MTNQESKIYEIYPHTMSVH